MCPSKRKHNFLLAAIVTICFIQLISLSPAIDVEMTIKTGEYNAYSISLNRDTENILDVYSNGSWNILLLTIDNFSAFVENNSFLAFQNFTGDGDYHTVIDPYGWNLTLFLVVRNLGATDLKVTIKLNQPSEFFITLRYTMRFVIIGAFFALSLFFLRRKNELLRSGEQDQAEVYSGFFWTYFFATINFFQSELFAWIRRDMEIQVIPDLNVPGFVSFRLDQIVFLLLLVVSDLFMTKQIEKRVGHFKHLYLTHMLESAAIALIVTPFILDQGIIIDILTIYALGVLLLTFLRIFYLYIRIAWDSSGAVRTKSLFIGLGLILPLVALIVGGNAIPGYAELSRFLMDCVTTFSAYLLYLGLK